MRRGKKAATEEVEEPTEEVADSGEDWNPDASAEQPTGGRGGGGGGKKRASKGSAGKGSKAKKTKPPPSEESEPEPEEEEDYEDEEEEDEDKNDSDANDSAMKDVPKYFHSGNFVLLKTDVKWDGDKVSSKLKDINIWKIDGKALLQKYVPLESNGKVLHKCTCAYSGWNVDNRENYYPISEVLDMNPKTDSKEVCVALNLDELIKVRDK